MNTPNAMRFRLSTHLPSQHLHEEQGSARDSANDEEPTRIWTSREGTRAAVPRPRLHEEPTERYQRGTLNALLLYDAVSSDVTEIPRASEAFKLLQLERARRLHASHDRQEATTPSARALSNAAASHFEPQHGLEAQEVDEFRRRVSYSVSVLPWVLVMALVAALLWALSFVQSFP